MQKILHLLKLHPLSTQSRAGGPGVPRHKRKTSAVPPAPQPGTNRKQTGFWGVQHPSGSLWHLQPSQAPFWGDTTQCSPKDQTALKTWLGRAAWVMKGLCQGNLPVPAPALPWNRGDTGESPRAPALPGRGTPTPCSTDPIPQQPGEVFLSPGICNQLMCAGNRASHRLAEEKGIRQISAPRTNPGRGANNPDSVDGSWLA